MADKPKLVLHICCAPDEAWVLKTLGESHDLQSFFCNPNIQPEEEYRLRLNEARRVADHFNIPFTADEYRPQDWENAVHDHRDSPEGAARCMECFLLRLKRTARFTRDIGFPAFTTVMSVSPYKKMPMLIAAGDAAAQEFGTKYEPFDFKKKDGYLNSVKLSKEMGIYRQDYCGCILSRNERYERVTRTKEKTALQVSGQ